VLFEFALSTSSLRLFVRLSRPFASSHHRIMHQRIIASSHHASSHHRIMHHRIIASSHHASSHHRIIASFPYAHP
ncbi:MAG: hypothetical protein R6U19_07945, partial [Bacteroidales bacterium]